MIWAEGRLAFWVQIKEYLVINHVPRISNPTPATNSEHIDYKEVIRASRLSS